MSDEAVLVPLLEALAPMGARARAMFGGHGLYAGDKFFGLVNHGRVYFRTDEDSRLEYVSRGMPPFQPANRRIGPKTSARNFEVPAAVLADPEQVLAWAIRATRA